MTDKDSSKIDGISERMTIVETTIMGADKNSGINGAVKTVEANVDQLEKDIAPIIHPKTGVNAQITELKEEVDKLKVCIKSLKTFKTKLITGFTVVQAVIVGAVYLMDKFNLWG